MSETKITFARPSIFCDTYFCQSVIKTHAVSAVLTGPVTSPEIPNRFKPRVQVFTIVNFLLQNNLKLKENARLKTTLSLAPTSTAKAKNRKKRGKYSGVLLVNSLNYYNL